MIIWKPRILSAHEDFPEIFPEIMGKPWPITEEDWIGTNNAYWAYIKKRFNKEMALLKIEEQQIEILRKRGRPVGQ